MYCTELLTTPLSAAFHCLSGFRCAADRVVRVGIELLTRCAKPHRRSAEQEGCECCQQIEQGSLDRVLRAGVASLTIVV